MFGYRIPEISAVQAHEALGADDADTVLLDIRSSHERAYSSIGGEHIEMMEIPARMDEIEPLKDRRVVVYCRSGNRSANVVAYLRAHGFDRAVNLRGGIIAWSREVDPDVKVY